MGLPVAAILKGVDIVFAGLEVADKVYTKVKRWNKTRQAAKARQKRIIEEIKKS